MHSALSVAIVMPAYNAAPVLERSLVAARLAARGGQVLVVDAGSDDSTAEQARSLGAQVLRLPDRTGPAEARNIGASHVDSDVVLFLDADCAAHPDVVSRVRAAFAADGDLVSLTGSFDDAPPEPNFFSQYMNLRHHLTNQAANTEGASFWAGCGAVRRTAFLSSGGFDAERYPAPMPTPMTEDVELGLRLARLGHCRLEPKLQVTHLKHWTLRSVLDTDMSRAVPWSQLILETGRPPNDPNLRTGQRVAAALSPLVLLSPLALIAAFVLGSGWLLAAMFGVLGLSLWLQRASLSTLIHLRGVYFGLRFYLFHQVYLCYSALAFGWIGLRYHFARRANREA
jgi:GT2 family glycosyltransferase